MVILLCMQALDGHIDMKWERHLYWPFRKFLVSRGTRSRLHPPANEFAQKFASVACGTAMSMLPEILFDVPGTAHCLGGCVIVRPPMKASSIIATAFSATATCTCATVPSSPRIRSQSQPDDYRAGRTRHELHPLGVGSEVG